MQDRLEQARQWFRGHHANVEPDASFAGRVAANLRQEPAEMMGRVAWRFLPACLAVIVVLAWFSLQVVSSSQTTQVASIGDDDVLEWVLQAPEATP